MLLSSTSGYGLRSAVCAVCWHGTLCHRWRSAGGGEDVEKKLSERYRRLLPLTGALVYCNEIQIHYIKVNS